MKARFLPALVLSALFTIQPVFAQVCIAPSFNLRDTEPTANQPNDVVAADFNLDGLLDLAVPNSGSSSVSILLGIPGGFTPSVTLDVSSATSVAAGDVNHDGKPDVAIVGETGANIYIALGDGLGDFTTPTSIAPSAGGPQDVHIGDFDNDGNPDLVVGYNGSGIAVHLGDGFGGFSTPALFPMGFTNQLEIADVDNDGNLDVITTEVVLFDIHVALGRGNGSFDLPTPFAAGLVGGGLGQTSACSSHLTKRASSRISAHRTTSSRRRAKSNRFETTGW